MVNFTDIDVRAETLKLSRPSTNFFWIVGMCVFGWAVLIWQVLAEQMRRAKYQNFQSFWEGFELSFCRVDVAIWGPKEYIGAFIMWTSMILAMMIPTLWPITQGSSQSSPGPTSVPRPSTFIGGYLILWSIFCLAAVWTQGFLHQENLLGINMALTDTRSGRVAGGAILLGAGLFQLSPLKQKYQRDCHHHMAMSAKTKPGFSYGFHYGLKCLKCCWPLMLVMFVFGLMNLLVMAILTVLMIAEKTSAQAKRLAKISGVVLIMTAAGLILS